MRQHDSMRMLFAMRGVHLDKVEPSPLRRPGWMRITTAWGDDDIPPYWLPDYRRAVYRLRWIRWRNRVYRIVGGHGVARANRIMRALGLPDPKLAEVSR